MVEVLVEAFQLLVSDDGAERTIEEGFDWRGHTALNECRCELLKS